VARTVVVPPVLPSPFREGLGVHGFPLESVHVEGLSRLQSSLDAAARIFGCPSPTRTLYSSFRSVESPRWTVEYSYAANSQLPRPDSHRQTLSRTGCESSREKAHRSLGQCLPLYPPFRVSWQSGHQALHHVSFSPSKIPYGGFSPVRLQAGRHQRQPSSLAGLICRPSCFSFHTQ